MAIAVALAIATAMDMATAVDVAMARKPMASHGPPKLEGKCIHAWP